MKTSKLLTKSYLFTWNFKVGVLSHDVEGEGGRYQIEARSWNRCIIRHRRSEEGWFWIFLFDFVTGPFEVIFTPNMWRMKEEFPAFLTGLNFHVEKLYNFCRRARRCIFLLEISELVSCPLTILCAVKRRGIIIRFKRELYSARTKTLQLCLWRWLETFNWKTQETLSNTENNFAPYPLKLLGIPILEEKITNRLEF